MNTKKVTKILIIISVIIILMGIFAGKSVNLELKDNSSPKENIYVDGTDFTALSEAIVSIGSSFLGVIITMYFAFAVVVIWIIYGVIILIIKIITKIKEKNIR